MSRNRFEDSGFARLYTWAAKAKFTMGIFFTMYVNLFLFLGLFIKGLTISIDFYHAVQMLFACFFIGLLQQVLIPSESFTRVRCALWVLSGALITLLFGLIFQWFSAFPVWCLPAFVGFTVFGMLMMILSYYLELHRETRHLNRKLEQFKKNKPEREA